MKSVFKFCLLISVSFLLFAFSTANDLKLEIVNSNIKLDVNEINLKDGVYLINKRNIQSLYVEVKSKVVSGKRANNNDFDKKKVKGVKYTLTFIEKLRSPDDKETIVRKEKVFLTAWNNNEIDTWNTKPKVRIGDYEFQVLSKN